VVIDGCPPRIPLTEEAIQVELDRRRPGQSEIVTPRKEADRCRILSGVFEGMTLGTPISVLVMNEDARSEAYAEMRTAYRPSHADYTYDAKYGIRNWQGGGRASARETIGRVAAGAVAMEVLRSLRPGIEIVAAVTWIHDIAASVDFDKVTRADVEANMVRCPDPTAAVRMIERIKEVRAAGDSVGGVIECVARNVPAGLGEPVFDKLEADLAKAMMSLPATKGFEIGWVLRVPGCADRSTTTCSRCATGAPAPRPTVQAVCKAASATANRSGSGSLSSRPRRFCSPSRPSRPRGRRRS